MMKLNQKIKMLEIVDYRMRGSAQYARNLLQYLEIPYKDVFLESPTKIDVKWVFSATHMLPLLRDGNFVVEGISPVIKYICRKYKKPDLLGKTPADAAKVQQLLIRNQQMKNSMIMQILPRKQWNSQDPQKRSQILKVAFQDPTRKSLLTELNKMVSNNEFFLGYFSVLDIMFYQLSFRMSGYFPELILIYPQLLILHKQRFQNIEQIKKYFQSDRMIKNLGISKTALAKWKGDPFYQ